MNRQIRNSYVPIGKPNMIHRVIITLLALACNAQACGASPEPKWVVKIQVTAPKCRTLYYVRSTQTAPYAPNKTLGQLCQLAHEYQLPWCFLIATMRRFDRPIQTLYFDAAIIYKFMQAHGMRNTKVPILKQFAHLIAQKDADTPTRVDLFAFNRYPSGLITVVNPHNNQLDVQLDYTIQLFDRMKRTDPAHLRTLVCHYCQRYNQADTGEAKAAKREAKFWLNRYMKNPALHDDDTHEALSSMRAFDLLQK